ncbi:hypothetical protein D3C72_2175460 [compost metagenome]
MTCVLKLYGFLLKSARLVGWLSIRNYWWSGARLLRPKGLIVSGGPKLRLGAAHSGSSWMPMWKAWSVLPR